MDLKLRGKRALVTGLCFIFYHPYRITKCVPTCNMHNK